MKKTITFFAMAAAAAAMMSCSQEIEKTSGEAHLTFKAYADASATKTSLGAGNTVEWSTTDHISVFDCTSLSNNDFACSSVDGRVASFSGMAELSSYYYAVSPFRQDSEISTDAGILSVTLPTVQTAIAGSFAPEANLSVAATKTASELYFKNVGALISLSYSFAAGATEHQISSVTISATGGPSTLTGRANITIDADGIPSTEPTAAVEYVTLAGSLTAGSRYYAVVYPGSYTGLQVTFADTEGKTATYTNSTTLNLERNANVYLGSISITDAKWVDAENEEYFEKVSTFDGAGSYLVVANYQSVNYAMKDFTTSLGSKTNDYTYLHTEEVTVEEDKVVADATTDALIWDIEQSGSNWLLKGSDGKYIYQTSSSYTNFYAGTSTSSTGYTWSISARSDGTFAIKNAAVGLTMQMSGKFKSFGIYTTTSDVYPSLYKLSSRTIVPSTDQPEIESTPVISTPSTNIDGVSPNGVTDAQIALSLVDAGTWSATVTCSGCVSAASLSDNKDAIIYTVAANNTSSAKSGTITITLTKDGHASITYTITVSQEAGEGPTMPSGDWTRVTSADQLVEGAFLVIACNTKAAVAGDISDSVMEALDATFSSDKSTITSLPDDAMILILGGSTGAWTFQNSTTEALLGATTVKKLAWGSGTKKWSISISSGNATISNGTSGYGKMYYNASSPRFTTYTSSQTAVQLYIKGSGSGSGGDTPVTPGTPTQLTMSTISCTARSTTSLTFNWPAVTGATKYGVIFNGGAEQEITDVTYMATGLSEGTSYTIQVRAIGDGESYTTSSYKSCTATTSTTSIQTDVNEKGWFELPVIKDDNKDGIIDSNTTLYYAYHLCEGGEKAPSGVTARNYTTCYSAQHHCPVWVAAPRHSMYVGSASRTNSYRTDPNIPSSIQYSSKSTGGGCNKGHMLGSAERTSSTATNRQVFYYTNIAPQNSSTFNTGGGAWNNLEDYVDKLVPADTLYEVVGCYFEKYTDAYGTVCNPSTISFGSRNDVSKPTMFYYALLRTKKGNTGKAVTSCSADELQCVAFVMSHAMEKGHKPQAKDLISITELEALTGFTYFPNVPQAPKSTYSASDWGL